MILARFWDADGVAHDYPDIWDVQIDPESATGVDFFQQEGRQASFGVKADAWLGRALIEPAEVLVKKYLPLLVEIKRDGVVIFWGFTQMGNEVEVQAKRSIIQVKVYDAICVLVDVNQDEQRTVEPGGTYNVLAELRNVVLPAVVENCRAIFEPFGVSWLDWFVQGPMGMDFRIWMPRWDSRNDVNATDFSDVIERRLTLHQVGSAWWLEWVECSAYLEFERYMGNNYLFRYHQHLIWLRMILTAEGPVLNLGDITRNIKSVDSYNIQSDDNDEEYLMGLGNAWAATVPSIMTGLGIPVANDILSATVGGEAWRIVNVIDGISVPGVVSSKCDAAVLQKYVDPANEFVVGAETDSVGLMEWLGGLLRILCAYLKTHAYGRVIQLLARLDYPGSSPILITNEDLLGPVRMVGSESMSIDADFSYLQDGDAVAAGVQEFYEDTILGAMPKEFEMDLVGRTWSVGQTINWNGWLILLTSVATDPIRNRASVKGMGGR